MKDYSKIIEKNEVTVGCARVSTPGQKDEQTIKSQIDEIKVYAKQHGRHLDRIYEDEGYSGDLRERPGIDKLIEDAQAKKFRTVIFTHIDRLGRDMLGQLIMKEKLKKLGIKILYTQIQLGDDPESEFTENIMGSTAQYFKDKLRRDTQKKKILKALHQGILITSKAPLGYDYIKRNINNPSIGQKYIINQDQAEIVELIFKLFVEDGLGIRAIARELTKLGYRTKNGNSVWRKSTISHILSNETYIGKAYYNKHERAEPLKPSKNKYPRMVKTSLKLRPKEEWIEIKVPAIIDKEIFKRAQDKLKERREHVRKQPLYPYLLTGYLECSSCRNRFHGNSSHGVPRYSCSGRRKITDSGDRCHAKSIKAAKIESAVNQGIAKLLNNPVYVIKYLQHITENKSYEVRKVQKEIKKRKDGIRKIDGEEARYYKLYGIEKFNQKIIEKLTEETAAKRRILNIEIRQLQQDIQHNYLIPENFTISEHFIEKCLKRMYGNYCQLSVDKLRKFLSYILNKVIYSDNKVVIKGNIPIFRHKDSWILSKSSEHYDRLQQLFPGRALHDVDL